MSLIWSDSVCPIARAAQPSMSTKIQVVHSSLRMGTRFSHRRNYESVREPYSYSAGLGNLKITLSFSAGGNTKDVLPIFKNRVPNSFPLIANELIDGANASNDSVQVTDHRTLSACSIRRYVQNSRYVVNGTRPPSLAVLNKTGKKKESAPGCGEPHRSMVGRKQLQ